MSRILLVPSLWKSLYIWMSIKSIPKYALLDDSVFRIIHVLFTSVVNYTFPAGNSFFFDLVPDELRFLANDTNY
jgi:hypothetical protein